MGSYYRRRHTESFAFSSFFSTDFDLTEVVEEVTEDDEEEEMAVRVEEVRDEFDADAEALFVVGKIIGLALKKEIRR
jgi:hypothetical protein